jgi:tetratricopeptide (TPR) repeat protein
MTGATNVRNQNSIVSLLFILIYTALFLCIAKAQEDAEVFELLGQIKEANSRMDSATSQKLWQRVLELLPRSAQANVQVGLALSVSTDFAKQKEGIQLLERAISPEDVDSPFALDTIQGRVLASTVGRWRMQMDEYHSAQKIIEAASIKNPDDLCLAALSAAILQIAPYSTQDADRSVSRYLKLTKQLILKLKIKPEWRLDEQLLSTSFPGAGPDPYVHCIPSIFQLSFYYRADVALVASRHHKITNLIWPDLYYVSDKAKQWIQSGKKKVKKQKINLGIASAMLNFQSSVVEDFKGALTRLDRNKFQITYIYIQERPGRIDPFVNTHLEDKVITLNKKESDFGHGGWIKRYHPIIEALDLDILFYLDLTMGTHATRLASAKLAPVQATSHGHPVTSGIPSTIIDYYISWGAAELEYDIAKTHYTEELKFLPTESLHQFYTPRSDENLSLIDRQNYRELINSGRESTFSTIPDGDHWYTCMQQPFKLFPEMDSLLCQVLAKDPLGRLILHKSRSKESQEVFASRLAREGCDMSRITFLDALPHHRLLALYALSDVILDSHPAGGCTTTREVLELGKALVTLPARLLGSRWTYAYYKMMGDEELNRLVIAQSSEEYVELSVQIGTSKQKRAEVERRVKQSVHRIHGRWESVTAWEKLFLEIAPVIIDSNVSGGHDEL